MRSRKSMLEHTCRVRVRVRVRIKLELSIYEVAEKHVGAHLQG